MFRDIAEVAAVAERGEATPMDMRLRNRLDHSFCTRLLVQDSVRDAFLEKFNTYADAQQKINLAIFERLRAMQVSLNPPLRNLVQLEQLSFQVNVAPLDKAG